MNTSHHKAGRVWCAMIAQFQNSMDPISKSLLCMSLVFPVAFLLLIGIHQPSHPEARHAYGTYVSISSELHEYFNNELDKVKPGSDIPHLDIKKISAIFKKHGVTEAYYNAGAVSESGYDMSFDAGLVIRLQDGRYRTLPFREKPPSDEMPDPKADYFRLP